MSLSPSVRPLHVPQINLDMYTSKRQTGLTRKEEFTKRLQDAELNIELWADNIQAIKDKELWREGGYDSFKEFCEKALHKSRQAVYRLLEAGETASNVNSKIVSPIGDAVRENPNESIPKISKEAQARALKSVPKEKRLEVLKKATEGNGKVTARAITEAAEALSLGHATILENGESVEDYEDKPRVVIHEPPKDMDGTVIPQELLSTWNRREEVQEAVTLASKLRSKIKELAGQSKEKGGKTDPLYVGMGWQAAITALNSIYYQLSECRPDVVCPLCKGTLTDPRFKNDRECPNCRQTGFVSERKRTEWAKGGNGRKTAEAFIDSK